MTKVCCISIVLFCLAIFAPAPAAAQEPSPSTTTELTAPAPSATGFDFDKLKTELDKQKSRQEAAARAPAKKKDAVSIAAAGLRMGMYLLALIVIFLVISWVVKGNSKKMIPARFLRGLKPKSRTMEVIDSLSLGQNRVVNLVRVQNQVLVLGVNPQHIQTLLTISDAAAVRHLLETLEVPARPLADFAKEVDYHLEILGKTEHPHA